MMVIFSKQDRVPICPMSCLVFFPETESMEYVYIEAVVA